MSEIVAQETDSQVIFIAGDIDPTCAQKFSCFSNWFPCKIDLDGNMCFIRCQSSELFLQVTFGHHLSIGSSSKYISNPDYQSKIRCHRRRYAIWVVLAKFRSEQTGSRHEVVH